MKRTAYDLTSGTHKTWTFKLVARHGTIEFFQPTHRASDWDMAYFEANDGCMVGARCALIDIKHSRLAFDTKPELIAQIKYLYEAFLEKSLCLPGDAIHLGFTQDQIDQSRSKYFAATSKAMGQLTQQLTS